MHNDSRRSMNHGLFTGSMENTLSEFRSAGSLFEGIGQSISRLFGQSVHCRSVGRSLDESTVSVRRSVRSTVGQFSQSAGWSVGRSVSQPVCQPVGRQVCKFYI